jgi:RNA polymerase sigma-70 factor (ECF subfamily)
VRYSLGEVSDDDRFPTTRWSQLAMAADRDTKRGQAALSEIFERYRGPVHRHVRRRVGDPAWAEDLTQTFFARILERNDLAAVDRARGRLRTYLLRAVDNLIANERERESAQKRGGHFHRIELAEVDAADESVDLEAAFDYDVALARLERAANEVGERYEKTDRTRLFEMLAPFLFSGLQPGERERLASELGLTPDGVSVALHRLRKSVTRSLHKIVEDEVDQDQVDDELRDLTDALLAR